MTPKTPLCGSGRLRLEPARATTRGNARFDTPALPRHWLDGDWEIRCAVSLARADVLAARAAVRQSEGLSPRRLSGPRMDVEGSGDLADGLPDLADASRRPRSSNRKARSISIGLLGKGS